MKRLETKRHHMCRQINSGPPANSPVRSSVIELRREKRAMGRQCALARRFPCHQPPLHTHGLIYQLSRCPPSLSLELIGLVPTP